MRNLIAVLLLFTSTICLGQFSSHPDVGAIPDYRDTLIYEVIVYEKPGNIITEIVMKDEFLRMHISDKRGVDVDYNVTYKGPATVNNKYRDYIEILELKIITY